MSAIQKKIAFTPGLMAALEFYSAKSVRMNALEETCFVYTKKNHEKEPWPVSRVCSMALEILEGEEVMRLKFIALKRGLKQSGMDRLYEHIMNESIDAARTEDAAPQPQKEQP